MSFITFISLLPGITFFDASPGPTKSHLSQIQPSKWVWHPCCNVYNNASCFWSTSKEFILLIFACNPLQTWKQQQKMPWNRTSNIPVKEQDLVRSNKTMGSMCLENKRMPKIVLQNWKVRGNPRLKTISCVGNVASARKDSYVKRTSAFVGQV